MAKVRMTYDLQSFESPDCPSVIFRGIVGSRAYGTQNPDSDTDVRGIFVALDSAYARLTPPPRQVSDPKNDRTYYSLLRFCELMTEANPTTLEMLFLPEDCVLKSSSGYSFLLENRKMFVTQKAVESHLGYAMSQIRKAKGANKRVWNPWPEEPPSAEDYCLFLADAKGRAVPVRKTGVDLSTCKMSRLGGCPASGIFALYDCGTPTGGVFHGGMLIESAESELSGARRLGVLVYNEQAFNSAKRQHREYWEWRRDRNESRWVAQERGEMDYDAKNMMHLVRLLMSAENIVLNGEPLVRFAGAQLETLLSIRRGEWTFADILALADEKKAVIESRKGDLPEDCDRAAVDALIASVMREVDLT